MGGLDLLWAGLDPAIFRAVGWYRNVAAAL
jgi:hypothetical protein